MIARFAVELDIDAQFQLVHPFVMNLYMRVVAPLGCAFYALYFPKDQTHQRYKKNNRPNIKG